MASNIPLYPKNIPHYPTFTPMNESIEVLITINLGQDLISKIEEVSDRIKITMQPTSTPGEIPKEGWQGVEVLFTHMLIPEPDQAPDLRWIQFYRAGNERLMDAPILQMPNLMATSLSGAAAPQVAEYVLEMILALGHQLPEVMQLKQQRTWPDNRSEVFTPVELNQSTVGIIGYGSIGREVARLVNAFGATVLACKLEVKKPADPGYMPEGTGDPHGDFVHRLYPVEALGSMIKECDFVLLSVPLTGQTHDLITAKELASMKQSAFLVDISRGGVVNHADLIAALREGRIAGAALDVFPEEPLQADNPLWELPNVIITPHIAGLSRFYDLRAVDLFIENLNRYLKGETLLNLIDLQRGY